MNLQAYIEQIEDFMGHEYGEVPRILNKEEFYSLACANEIKSRGDTPEVRAWLENKFEEEWTSLSKSTAALYNGTEHVIVSMQETISDLTLTHELSHAYLRNQWPGYYKMWLSAQRNGMRNFKAMQNYFVKNALIEGHADTVALNVCPKDECDVRLQLFSLPRIWTKEYMIITFAQSLNEENPPEERYITFQIGSRSIGYNVVNNSLKKTDDRHETFKQLLLEKLTPEKLYNRLFY
ncbi:hypothetical protein GOV10_02290 [Candidatus Woesearchaeota archaeon]|nr:hypothetical protein [Candidatus Woesearchaeota archaeon]